jgi:cellobiose-specific phosphotransferase system component IIC
MRTLKSISIKLQIIRKNNVLKAMREGMCELTPLLGRGELTLILQIFQFKE